MGNNVAKGAIGATAVGGAAAGAVAVGAAGSIGQVLALVRRGVQAGDEGWDSDGNFVSSKFVFNFKTMEVFDGSETHPIRNISEYSYVDHAFKIVLRDRMKPKQVLVGFENRSETVARAIDRMWKQEVMQSDKKHPLPTFKERVRRLKLTTIFRYSLRALILGGFLAAMIISNFRIRPSDEGMAIIYLSMIFVFVASVAWRKLRPVKEPRWSNHT